MYFALPVTVIWKPISATEEEKKNIMLCILYTVCYFHFYEIILSSHIYDIKSHNHDIKKQNDVLSRNYDLKHQL